MSAATDILEAEWGEDYPKRFGLAQEAWRLASSDFNEVEVADGELLGNNIHVIRLLSELGEHVRMIEARSRGEVWA